jgi:hypothetical protein
MVWIRAVRCPISRSTAIHSGWCVASRPLTLRETMYRIGTTSAPTNSTNNRSDDIPLNLLDRHNDTESL